MTGINVKTMFHHEEDSVTVAVIATVDTEDVVVNILKLSIKKILEDNSTELPNVIDTFNDLEVTGYLPSCMLLHIVIMFFICTYQLVFAVQCNCDTRAKPNLVNAICMGANVPPCIMINNGYQVNCSLYSYVRFLLLLVVFYLVVRSK